MANVRWHTREDSGLRLDRQQRWWHDDEPIEHPNIIEAFNRGLRVMPDGRYQLQFGNDWAYVKVDGCAFQVVAVDESEPGRLSVRLSDRTGEWLDVPSLRLDDEGVMTVAVKGGQARARFSRDAQYQLGQYLVEDGDALALQLGATKFSLPVSR